MTLLVAQNLSAALGSRPVLHDISLSLASGHLVALVGPNGAGKTTLLEAVAGLLPIDEGRVLWRGTPLRLAERREFIFYLPDGLRPWDDQYVARVIDFFAATYGRSEGLVAQTISSVGLAPVLRKRVRALSKGFARRLMLARR